MQYMHEGDDDPAVRPIHVICEAGDVYLGSGGSETVDNDGGLGRHLGLFSTTALIVSSMIGTGIFSVPSSIISSVGSTGAALLLWVVGLVLSFCGLFVWLEWGCLYPRSGGEKVYLQTAYPRPRVLALALYAIQSVLLSTPAAGCVVFAENFSMAAGYNAGDIGLRATACAVVLFAALIHAFAPKIGVKMMDTLSIIQIFMLMFVDFSGLMVLLFGTYTISDPRASFRNAFSASSPIVYDYSVALLKVMQTYYGWSYPAYVLNEIKNPVRTLKIAGPLGLGTVGLLYILANVAYFSVASPAEIAESGVTVGALYLGKLCAGGKLCDSGITERVAAAFVSLSAVGFVMAHTFSMARVNQELAKDGIIPFSKLWARNWRTGTPIASLSLVFLVTFLHIIAIPFGDAYNFIMDVMAYPTALMSFSVTLGLLLHRHRIRQARSFKVWTPLAILFLVAQTFLIVSPFLPPRDGKGDITLSSWLAPLVGWVAVLFGTAVWWIWRILIPWTGYFYWESYEVKLRDGTRVTKWKKAQYPFSPL